jgi:uncharacterized membrane-anchored protein
MDLVKRWSTRVGAVATAAVLAVLVPTMAWASSHPDVLAVGDELAKRRRGGGIFGLLFGVPTLCCCAVVVAIVAVVVVIMRRRNQRPPAPPQY